MLKSPFFMLEILPAHLIFIFSLFTLNITWPWVLAWFIMWIIVGGIGIEVGYHRAISHNHFNLSERTKKILGIVGMFGMNGGPMSWRALHVVHHRFADTDKDLHSPIHGLFRAYLSYTWVAEQESKKGNLALRFAVKKMLHDKYWVYLDRWIHYIVFFILVVAVILNMHIAFLLSAVMITCYNQTALINIFAHGNSGKRSFDTNDMSVNKPILGLFTFGLALHNNHHALPGNANFGNNQYLDVGYYLGKAVSYIDKKL